MDISFFKKDLENGRVFIMLVGPPCSGKSEVAGFLNEEGDFVIVRPDDIRHELLIQKGADPSSSEVFKIIYEKLVSLLDDGYNIIYDATNCRSNYRIKIMNVIEGHADISICLVSMVGLLDCLKKNESVGGDVPSDVIERMYFTVHKYPPNIYEGYDAIFAFGKDDFLND